MPLPRHEKAKPGAGIAALKLGAKFLVVMVHSPQATIPATASQVRECLVERVKKLSPERRRACKEYWGADDVETVQKLLEALLLCFSPEMDMREVDMGGNRYIVSGGLALDGPPTDSYNALELLRISRITEKPVEQWELNRLVQ